MGRHLHPMPPMCSCFPTQESNHGTSGRERRSSKLNHQTYLEFADTGASSELTLHCAPRSEPEGRKAGRPEGRKAGRPEGRCQEFIPPCATHPEQAIRSSVAKMVVMKLSSGAHSTTTIRVGAGNTSVAYPYWGITLYRRHQTMHQHTLHVYRTVARTGVPGSPTGVAPTPCPRG